MITVSKLKKKLKGIGCYYPANGKFDKFCETFLTEIAEKMEENIKITSAFWTLSVYEEEENIKHKRFGLFCTTEHFINYYSIPTDKDTKEEELSLQQFDFKKITNSKVGESNEGDIAKILFTYNNKELIFVSADQKVPKNVNNIFMAIEAKSMFADKGKIMKMLEMMREIKGLEGIEALKEIEEFKNILSKKWKI